MAIRANERTELCRLVGKPTNERSSSSEGHAFSGEKLVPALPWPFPVLVQCCETEKAMCVDAKVNFAPRNYHSERRGAGCDGYFRVFLPKLSRRPTETALRPKAESER